MKRILLVIFVGIFSVITAAVANALVRRSAPVPEVRMVPITKIAIEPDAPLSIGVVTKATARVFKVEVVNISGKTIRAFSFTVYKQCATASMPAGGIVMPEKGLKPGDKIVFDAGEDDLVRQTDIQNCLDTAKEIRVQIKTVTFTDGSTWLATAGDFNGIRSSCQ